MGGVGWRPVQHIADDSLLFFFSNIDSPVGVSSARITGCASAEISRKRGAMLFGERERAQKQLATTDDVVTRLQ